MSDPIEIPVLNRNFTNEKISMPYPHVLLLEPSDAVALVLPSLPSGDLPVICNFEGVTKQIGSVMKSARVLTKLMLVSDIEYVKEANMSIKVSTPQDAVNLFLR